MSKTANERQVGGSHYAAGLQHWDLIERYGLGYLEGCATKYLTRWRKKNGVQDLEKAGHYTQKLLELAKEKVRPPRGCVPEDVLVRFFEANECGHMERIIIGRLCTWARPADLDRSLTLLEELIAQAKAEPVHEDKTGQTAPFGYQGDR
jgi:hypothetical protein